jgi:hypothetical protein
MRTTIKFPAASLRRLALGVALVASVLMPARLSAQPQAAPAFDPASRRNARTS